MQIISLLNFSSVVIDLKLRRCLDIFSKRCLGFGVASSIVYNSVWFRFSSKENLKHFFF